tara:strand:- start:3165 stop:3575 length:411 start_codon:yes stop_codon:yes gene_type:complete
LHIFGIFCGLSLEETLAAIQLGMGETLSSLVMILGFGAMLGKLIAESGAADKITHKLVTKFGRKHIQSSLILVGFIIGIPLFYTVGFVILVPFDVNSITDLQKIPEILGNRGYSENDIKNICGNNWIQFLRNAWDK